MRTDLPSPDAHQDMRETLRDLCGSFDSAYWQTVDDERGYPEAFFNAPTQAGWLAALIPSEYGGSGLGLTEASVIMEEINFSGGNAGSCHGHARVADVALHDARKARPRHELHDLGEQGFSKFTGTPRGCQPRETTQLLRIKIKIGTK